MKDEDARINRVEAYLYEGRWHTKEKLRCDSCSKRCQFVFQIETVLSCPKCALKTIEFFFKTSDREYVNMRSIEDVLFNTRKETIKRERSKSNLKTRFEVLTRDRFKCVLCGAVAQEVKLEIDHIVPVSKGGKTEMSNLRTLCFPCNRGKGDTYGQD